jgi:hypothetical protein
MAIKVAIQDGNWSAAATWNSVVSTYATTSQTSITGSYVNSATFTAANTTNAITGIVIPFQSVGTSNLTVALQFDTTGAGAWADQATETFALTDANSGSKNVLVKFTTPYTPTSTAANRHRFRIIRNSGGTTSIYVSGTTVWTYLAVYAATGVPASTDDVMILGNVETAYTVTLDGNQTIGSATGTNVGSNNAQGNMSTGYAVLVDNYGKLAADRTASWSLTCAGAIYRGMANAYIDFGTEASPITSSYTGTITFTDSLNTKNGFGSTTTTTGDNGSLTVRGAEVTNITTGYSSGSGTTGSPLITTTTTGWAVNDKILITTTDGTYNHSEYKFIKTISGTSITLSNTAGGVEAGLTYTHNTSADILHLTRNVVIKCDSATKTWAYHNQKNHANQWFRWAQMENVGNSTSYNYGLSTGYVGAANGQWGTITGCVFDNFRYNCFYMGDANTFTANKCFFVNSIPFASTRSAIDIQSTAGNKTFTDCYWVDNNQAALAVAGANITLTGGEIVGCNVTNSATQAGLLIATASYVNITNVNIHTNRQYGILVTSSTAKTKFDNCNIGVAGTNTIDLRLTTNSFADISFEDCTFGSATLISNYLNMVDGSEIRYFMFGSSDTDHRWYTNKGSARSSGSGLTDTTVRTASSLAQVMIPENNSTGMTWEFTIPAIPQTNVYISGYMYRNATFSSGTLKIEIFLPETPLTGAADTSYTFPTTTSSWLPFNVSAYYSGSTTFLATVRVTAVTATAGAKVFLDDFYDAGLTNKIAGFDLWNDGKPVNLFVANDVSGIPGLVWQYPDTNTATNTMGQRQVDAADDAELAAIK